MYVKKDSNGEVIAISLEPSDGSTIADTSDPAVKAFLTKANPDISAGAQLRSSDADSVRIIEDLVDTLIGRGVIRFTDLPNPAQERLLERKLLRKIMRKEEGLPDEDEQTILSDDQIF